MLSLRSGKRRGPRRRLPRIAAAAYYFFFFGSLGAFFPFLSLILRERGFSATEIGRLMVLMPLGTLLVPPLWGYAADRLQARATLMRLCTLGASASLLLLVEPRGLAGTFAALLVFNLFRPPLVPLADAATRSVLAGEGSQFGRIRVWGSIGFTLAVWGAGLAASAGTVLAHVLIPSLCYVGAALATVGLPQPSAMARAKLSEEVWHAMTRPRFLLLLAATAAYYAGHATNDAFLGLHLEDLGASRADVGKAWALGVAVEIGVMWVSPLLFKRVPASRLVFWCVAAAILRWLLLGHLTDPDWAFWTQPLHGLTFGLWYLCLVDEIQRGTPEHLRNTLQTAASASMGLGMTAGFLAGGAWFETHHGGTMYHWAAGAALVSLGLYGVRSLIGSSRV